MRSFLGAAALTVMLAGATTFAQAPAPVQPAPRPAAPTTPAPAQPAPAPKPFPEGTKYAFVNIQRIAAESAEGKLATAKVQALNQQKVTELNERNKALQTAQQKLEAGASVLSVTAAATLQKDIERQQVDIQRFTEDAQQEVAALQQQLQDDFQQKLTPVIQAVAQERGLHMLFSVADSGLVWGEPSLDLTADIIVKFDTARPAPAAPRPAAPPPATAKPAAPPATAKPAPPPPAPKPN